MAAIGLAESRGRNVKQKGQPAATTGWGIWQITPGSPSLLDPKQNARAAVAKYRAQGLRAWSTYTNGTYKQFLEQGVSGPATGSFGIYSSAHYAGADQGVDFTGAGLIPALDPLTITSVRQASIIEGGSYPLVGFKFTGGPYKGRYGYVMENFEPLVKPGQRLKRGQAIGRAKGSFPYIETGFASGPEGSPLAPLGADPHAPTSAGIAYASYIGQRIGEPLTPSGAKPPGPRGPAFANYPTDPQATLGGATGVPGAVVSGVGSVVGAVTAPVKWTEAVAHFLGKLTDPKFWLRALEVVGGIVLVLLGLYLLARNVGLAQPVEDLGSKLPGAKLSEEAAAALHKSPGTYEAERAPRRRRSVDVSETGSRREAIRRRSQAALAAPADEIPF
jgi:hypothetical protein